jgi:hypothetical protein
LENAVKHGMNQFLLENFLLYDQLSASKGLKEMVNKISAEKINFTVFPFLYQ